MFDFVLQKTGIFLQGFSELGNTFTDSQQLHWVAIMVPWRGYILTENNNRHIYILDLHKYKKQTVETNVKYEISSKKETN